MTLMTKGGDPITPTISGWALMTTANAGSLFWRAQAATASGNFGAPSGVLFNGLKWLKP